MNERVVAVIPARGGSKGVPRKNIRDLCGKPVIAWTIEAALAAGRTGRFLLSSLGPGFTAAYMIIDNP